MDNHPGEYRGVATFQQRDQRRRRAATTPARARIMPVPGVGVPGMEGSVRAVPYWNHTFAIAVEGSNPAGMPDSRNVTAFFTSGTPPVTTEFPVAGLSPAEVSPKFSPSTFGGGLRSFPGNRS